LRIFQATQSSSSIETSISAVSEVNLNTNSVHATVAPTESEVNVAQSLSSPTEEVLQSAVAAFLGDKSNWIKASMLFSDLRARCTSLNSQPLEIREAVVKSSTDAGVEVAVLEEFLGRDEFERVFEVAPEAFKEMPLWKQIQFRKKLRLIVKA
jgi:hypothetical protein